uniref:Uncharacterized protein n=1 Tax=Anguilla anguilla TaxID=7936 RepID=A0A0E9WKF1_ANGAN
MVLENTHSSYCCTDTFTVGYTPLRMQLPDAHHMHIRKGMNLESTCVRPVFNHVHYCVLRSVKSSA